MSRSISDRVESSQQGLEMQNVEKVRGVGDRPSMYVVSSAGTSKRIKSANHMHRIDDACSVFDVAGLELMDRYTDSLHVACVMLLGCRA